MEKQLSIGQVQTIMGWSYQTALKFANRHGEMVGGKWQVPSQRIADSISALSAKVDGMNIRFISVVTRPAELA